MNIFQALILGILQGLTEFLPVSSSGHLILLPSLLGWDIQSLAFDTVLHLGTAAALIVYFWSDLTKVIKSKKYLILIGVGTLPAVTGGLLFGNIIENTLRTSSYVAAFLLVGSVIMFVAEKAYKKVWHTQRIEAPEKLDFKQGITIGVFQSLALFSGISRSGSTMSGGMYTGLTRESAARFSFILSIPIVIGAGLFKVAESYQELSFDLAMLAGFLASFLMGILAIKYLLRFLKTNTLYVFIIYRVILSLLVILLVT